MAYNGYGGYVDATRSRLEPDELSIVTDSEMFRSPRYPYSVVWTPIPLLTWMFPFLGHMGICTSTGVIRDFAGSYYVSEDQMAFGNPVKVWELDPSRAKGASWDVAVADAAEVYKSRVHNLCCDNCHSMVALALNNMKYDGKSDWNMVSVCMRTMTKGHYVSFCGFLKTWLPFCIIVTIFVAAVIFSR